MILYKQSLNDKWNEEQAIRPRIKHLIGLGGSSGLGVSYHIDIPRPIERLLVQIRHLCSPWFGVVRSNMSNGQVEAHVCTSCSCIRSIDHVLFHCPLWCAVREQFLPADVSDCQVLATCHRLQLSQFLISISIFDFVTSMYDYAVLVEQFGAPPVGP